MGMSIDDAKLQLSMQKFYVLGKDYEAVQVAIDIMRKYQKIEDIVENRLGKPSLAILNRIIKVVENGNDD